MFNAKDILKYLQSMPLCPHGRHIGHVMPARLQDERKRGYVRNRACDIVYLC